MQMQLGTCGPAMLAAISAECKSPGSTSFQNINEENGPGLLGRGILSPANELTYSFDGAGSAGSFSYMKQWKRAIFLGQGNPADVLASKGLDSRTG